MRKLLLSLVLLAGVVPAVAEALSSTPARFRDFMTADLAKWARVAKQSGAKFE